jgi:fermentation-respiration switch protein FrsA (DUF1100 family)
MKKITRMFVSTFIFFPIVLYVAIMVLLWVMRHSLLYPGAYMYQDLDMNNVAYAGHFELTGFDLWENEDGEWIGFYQRHPGAEQDWVIFYGNGDHAVRATAWAAKIREFLPQGTEANFYIMEYPGYAMRGGRTSEKTVIRAAEEIMESIPTRNPRFLLGQSMGAAVACRIAGDHPEAIRGILLVTPYTTLDDAARSYLKNTFGPFHYLMPASLLLEDEYRNEDHILRYPGKVVILAGELDSLTPPELAEELYQTVPGEKRFWVQPGVGHWAEFDDVERWKELIRFLVD